MPKILRANPSGQLHICANFEYIAPGRSWDIAFKNMGLTWGQSGLDLWPAITNFKEILRILQSNELHECVVTYGHNFRLPKSKQCNYMWTVGIDFFIKLITIRQINIRSMWPWPLTGKLYSLHPKSKVYICTKSEEIPSRHSWFIIFTMWCDVIVTLSRI